MRLFLVLVSILIMVIAFWLTIDTDLPLYLSSAAPEMAFEDKIVWITGASSGIGASLAGDLARAGAQVIISARRGDKLDAVVRSINDFGTQASHHFGLSDMGILRNHRFTCLSHSTNLLT